jgi:hypothetical protein
MSVVGLTTLPERPGVDVSVIAAVIAESSVGRDGVVLVTSPQPGGECPGSFSKIDVYVHYPAETKSNSRNSTISTVHSSVCQDICKKP